MFFQDESLIRSFLQSQSLGVRLGYPPMTIFGSEFRKIPKSNRKFISIFNVGRYPKRRLAIALSHRKVRLSKNTKQELSKHQKISKSNQQRRRYIHLKFHSDFTKKVPKILDFGQLKKNMLIYKNPISVLGRNFFAIGSILKISDVLNRSIPLVSFFMLRIMFRCL